MRLVLWTLLLLVLLQQSVNNFFQLYSNEIVILRVFQESYLLIDSISVNVEKKYVNAVYSAQNTSDGEGSLLSFDVEFLVEVLREQLRLKMFTPRDESDQEYTKLYMSTPIDTCKVHTGVRTTLLMKVVFENFMKSVNSDYTCPFAKNSHIKLTNCTLTDNLLPPIPNEQKFKIEIDYYGIIKGKKGWTYMYGTKTYGRCRKWIN